MTASGASNGKGRADLHAHTSYSDGKESPARLVERARAAGLALLAVTDHDILDGIDEAREAANGTGLQIAPGIEFSTRLGGVEIHILGLWIDHHDPELTSWVAELGRAREERARRMVELCRGHGLSLDFGRVLDIAGRGVVGRPHVAQALVESGAVRNFGEAFRNYIGRTGPCYAPKLEVHPAVAIDATHRAGGVAVLAHGLLGGAQREHVKQVIEMGLDGLEVIHPKLTADQGAWLREQARERGLAVSAGCDWHGEGWSDGVMGNFTVGPDEVADLKKRAPSASNHAGPDSSPDPLKDNESTGKEENHV